MVVLLPRNSETEASVVPQLGYLLPVYPILTAC